MDAKKNPLPEMKNRKQAIKGCWYHYTYALTIAILLDRARKNLRNIRAWKCKEKPADRTRRAFKKNPQVRTTLMLTKYKDRRFTSRIKLSPIMG